MVDTAKDFTSDLTTNGIQAVEIVSAALLQNPFNSTGASRGGNRCLQAAAYLRRGLAACARATELVCESIQGQRSIEALVRHTVERIEPGMKRKAQASRLIARGQSAEFGLCKSSVYT